MIEVANTNVSRDTKLYRVQVDEYEAPNYDILRVFENNGRKGIRKKVKTIYDDKGIAWLASVETGEILSRKPAREIKRCVDTSISRTRRVMREILMANTWDWFVTLTFNNVEQDRTNDKTVISRFKYWRLNVRKQFPHMRYFGVMERHKDGCIHFHLVLGGVSEKDLRLVYSGHNDKSGRKIYNCYAWKYGFSTVTAVDSTEKVSGYLLKYIGKDLGVTEEGKKRYWASKNCERPRKRYFDIKSDEELNVFDFFHKFVDRTISMIVQYWNKAKNYVAIKDTAPNLRKMRFFFDRFNLHVHDNFWKCSRTT